MPDTRDAPELIVTEWLNTDAPLSLGALRGRVVLIYAFQMRCPGCVTHSIPQAKRAHAGFDAELVQVLGLHTVFENHAAMGPAALRAFAAEHELRFPIGIDAESPSSSIPQTMRRYDMQGTPTLVAIDAQGQRRFQHLGHLSDAQLATIVAELVAEATHARSE